jgi:hypothetical protein
MILDTIQHPAIIFLFVVGVLWLRHKILRTRGVWPDKFIRLAASLVVVVYCGLMLVYLLKPGYWNPVESSVTVIAQQLKQGRQIYHAIDAAPRFSLLYGPSVFISNAAALSLLGNPILASKLSGVFWAIAALLASYLALRRSFGNRIAIIGLGLVAALALWHEHYTYWNKADSLLLFCTSLGLAAVLMRRKRLGWLILSLAIGIAVNAKVHAPVYFVPIIALLYVRQGWRACLPPIALSAIWISLPFVLFPQSISLANYVTWLTDLGSLPLSSMLLGRNLEYGFLLVFLPSLILAAVFARGFDWRKMFAAILPVLSSIASVLAVTIIGAHPAAGEYHLIPFIPIIVYLTADLYLKVQMQIRQAPSWLALKALALSTLLPAWIIASAATIVIGQIQIGFYDFIIPDESAIQSDLLTVKEQYAAYTLQMGYGDVVTDRATYFRPWLYSGHIEYFLDSQAMMDMQGVGVAIPPATLATFTTQQFDIWLIPRRAIPFSLRNSWYDDHPALFSPKLQQVFLANYVKVASSQYYDIWQAKRLTASKDG